LRSKKTGKGFKKNSCDGHTEHGRSRDGGPKKGGMGRHINRHRGVSYLKFPKGDIGVTWRPQVKGGSREC